jgi:signal transduction histidine kinase/ligand-binding sensor domain-containing protein
MVRICIVLFLLGALNTASALDPRKALTQYSASVWTQQQGLPQDAIQAIAQTGDGYLWVATDEGLARFDGYEFVNFSRLHSISALAAGRDGSLWIGSRSGLTNYSNGRFRTYTRRDGLIDDLVSAVFVDHNGIVWIVAGGNLSRFDGTHFTTFLHDRDVPLRTVRAVTEGKDQQLYVCGNSAVVRFANGRFETVIGPDVLSGDFPSHIQTDRSGNLWLTSARGVIERLPDGTLKSYRANEGLSDAFGLNAIAEDSGGTIWVGTGWGLARLEGNRFASLPRTRDGAAVRCILEDREGNLWVGSDTGLTRYRDDLLTSLGKSEGLPDNGPSVLYEDKKGVVWAGYDDGLVMMKDRHATPIRVSNANLFLRHLRETSRGELLAPSRQGLIRIKDGHQTTFVPPDPQGRKTVFDALETKEGSLWLALPNGLGELEGDRFRTVIPAGPLFQDDSFYVLARGADGAIWAGTLSNGLWRYKDGEQRHFTAADGLSSAQIRSLYADKAGTLWIGTLDGGLNAFRDGRFVSYRARDGLLSDNIYSITDDGASLWLSTPRGICRVPRQQLTGIAGNKVNALRPANYGVDDGMRSAQTTDGRRFADGTLWFATSRGIAVYDPRVNGVKVLPPLIHIFDLSKGRRVQIRYAAVHLRAPDRVRYSYMLEGSDAGWVSVNADRAVNYDGLPHGRYCFRVKAELPGGPWSESALEFDLAPFFYETAWFRLLCVLALMMAVWSAYKLRERQVRSRFAAVLQERARLAREVHDTLAQGFVGIASQLDVVEMTMPADAAPARSALELARRMARHSLTEARRSLRDLRAAALEDQDLAVALESGVERWVARSGAKVKVDVNGDASGLPEEVAHHVFRIAQEAVANAINHAAPNRINLELRIEPKQLRLHVEDDGRGFEPEGAFTSTHGNFGLIGMRERAERLEGELHLASEPGKGTRLDVTVPLKSARAEGSVVRVKK